jgi:hypothetical protein
MRRPGRFSRILDFRRFSVSKTRLTFLCLLNPLVLFNARHEKRLIITAGRLRPREQ